MRSEEAVALRAVEVLGTGTSLPGPALTTGEVLARVAPHLPANAGPWARRIAQRLAIETRHLSRSLAEPIEAVRAADSAPRLAARALRAALAEAGARVDKIEFLIGHTATPHTLLPSNTAWTADELGYGGPHVELRQACSGFAASVLLADGLLATSARAVAIVGSETGSVFFDPRRIADDRSQIVNLVQMGDGAGAALLGPLRDESRSRIERPFYGSLGLGRTPGLALEQGGSGSPLVANGGLPHFTHRHEDIRAHGLTPLRACLAAAQVQGVDLGMVEWFVPHPANGRMAGVCAEHLGLPEDRVVCDAGRVGNLGSAAIWVALDRLRRSGRLQPGHRVLVLGAEATKYLYGGFLYVHGAN